MENSSFNSWEVSEVKLKYTKKVKADQRPKITCSRDSVKLLRRNWDRNTIELFEEFKIICVNRNNKAIAMTTISKGGVAGTVADPKIIFAYAIKTCATGIILAHNHPSENLTPSAEDIQHTKKIIEGGKYLEIQVLDHIILTAKGYFSFADESLM